VHANAVAGAWDLVTTYPGMLLAALGFGALVMVVVTSVRAARRRLRYESWHLLHLYAYLGVGLALPLRQVGATIAEHHVYICGPQEWTEAVRAAARSAGVPRDRLHTELFAW
jgi:ferredoxin-NADP reductase